jgi:hypothetical protein
MQDVSLDLTGRGLTKPMKKKDNAKFFVEQPARGRFFNGTEAKVPATKLLY